MDERRNKGMEEIMLMLGRMDEKLDAVKEQTTKTNGRVTSLEARMNKNDILHAENRSAIKTWVTVGTLISGFVLFVVNFVADHLWHAP